MKSDDLKDVFKKLNIDDIEMEDVSNIGEGAWHDGYKIERSFEEDFVVRMKKEKAYGQILQFDDIELMTEYEASKVYYEQANQCLFNICPKYFSYYLEKE